MLNQQASLNLSRAEVAILKADVGDKIEDIEDLFSLIKIVSSFAGIKELPDNVIKIACWKTLDHFRSFTKQNFIQAFEYNEAGVYETRVQHFNAFLPAYMSEVLNNYRSMRNRAQSEYKKQLKALEPPPEPITAEQSFNGLNDYVTQNKELPKFWDWNKSFIHMEDVGMIKITLAEKIELKEKVENELNAKKQFAANKDELKDIVRLLESDSIVTECRKRVITNYFKK